MANEFEQMSAALAEVSAWNIYAGLPVDMKSWAGRLETLQGALKQGRPARSGRNHYLFYLAKLVGLAMNSPHYDKLCDLITAVQEDPHGNKVPSVKSIKRKVDDFEKAHPIEAGLLKEEAEEDLARWQKSPARK